MHLLYLIVDDTCVTCGICIMYVAQLPQTSETDEYPKVIVVLDICAV